MSRIDDIFLRVRDTLNDPNTDRWSDDTLMRNLQDGIKDIAIHTNLYKHIKTIPLISGESTFQMPAGTLNLSHVTYKSELLPLKSSGYMEANYAPDWRTHTVELPDGDLKLAIYDEVKRCEIATYPRPFGDFSVFYDNVPNEFGLVGALEFEGALYPQDSYEGLVNEFVDSDMARDIQDSYYGVVTAVEEIEILTIYYSRTPPLPTATDDDLEIDECFDRALRHYIVGMCLRNDLDQQNRQFGAEELTIYQREVDGIIQLSHVDSVAANAFESHYQSGIE
jgi:hypothetical protein